MGIQERKAREKLRRYNEIVNAAERLFFTRGIDRVTMDDIASEAELAKGTLYLYFKNREDLHYAVVLRAIEILNGLVRQAYEPGATGLENIRRMGEAYVQFFYKHPDYFRTIMLFDASRFERVQKEKQMKILEPESPLMFFRTVIHEGQNDGSIRSDIPPEEMAILLWSQVSGVFEFIELRGTILSKLNIDPSEIIKHQFIILADGLQKR